MLKILAVAAACAFSSQWAAAGTLTGNQLATLCASYTDPDSALSNTDAAFCVGYIGGVAETLNIITSTKSGFCLANAVSKNQLVLVVKSYMQEHPDKLAGPLPIVVYNALVESYPCG